VANAIRRARAGLQDPNRPLGSFIFLGPTGVGKTELARALAEFLFDDEQAMVRIDMSEYQEKHAVSRLIGAPPGYVGYEEAGQLTEAVRRRPYAVVLFDEIEKAHPEVLNVMLQLPDGQGRTVDFRNAVVIMTSNVGSHFIAERALMGETALDEAVRRQLLDALRQHFKPEFLNRIDDVIFFHALDRDDIRQIIDIQVRALVRRLEDRKIRLDLTDRARDQLIEEGYDPVYGARPLKRTIQRRVLDPLAMGVLQGTFGEGDVVTADADDQNAASPQEAEADDSAPPGQPPGRPPTSRASAPVFAALADRRAAADDGTGQRRAGRDQPGRGAAVLPVPLLRRRGPRLRRHHHGRSHRRHLPERLQEHGALLHGSGG
jgi:ATP-dependent Clp protease ATP-binding subunit ClpB